MKKTIEEIRDWLLENCVDRDGDLYLNGLDFSEFKGNVYIGEMKVNRDLVQNYQKVGGYLWQNSQEVEEYLYQHDQRVGKDLYQHNQKPKRIKRIKSKI